MKKPEKNQMGGACGK